MIDQPPPPPPIISIRTDQCPAIAAVEGLSASPCLLSVTGEPTAINAAHAALTKEGWNVLSGAPESRGMAVVLAGSRAEQVVSLWKRLADGAYGPLTAVDPAFKK